MKYWIVKNMQDEFIGITDEEPEPGITQKPNGVHFLLTKKEDTSKYIIFQRIENDIPIDDTYWKPVLVIKKISKEEYETYKEFGL